MIKSLTHLCSILKINKCDLNDIVLNIDKHYGEWSEIKYNKDGSEKTRRGRVLKRTYNPSSNRLKQIQKLINRSILTKLQYPEYIHGGVKKKSNITNAAQHVGKMYKFSSDLRDFFPSITYDEVYKMFLRYNFSPDVASKLTKLTTYKGHVPQGAPTSSYIANLTFTEIESALHKLALENNLTMTTYIDDVSFSANHCFRECVPLIIKIINDGKHAISQKKTFYTIGRSNVTGIVVGQNGLTITDSFKEKIAEEQDILSDRYKGLTGYKMAVKNYRKRK